jgi:hypothetical protein
MTNAQAPMTNQTANYNDQWRAGLWALPFRFRFIGHWCFVIGHSAQGSTLPGLAERRL